jgi:hypothetical protein
MTFVERFKNQLFDIEASSFEAHALALFRYQAVHNAVYSRYLQYLDVKIENIVAIDNIPFLPISFFKHHWVQTGTFQASTVFESSRTTGSQPSRHAVADPAFYLRVCRKIFESFYGSLSDFQIFALLPSYQERNNSSLIYMTNDWIRHAQAGSGYFLNQDQLLIQELQAAQQQGKKTLLIGVTFALLELAQKMPTPLPNLLLIETGGMKGRGKERVRPEVHQILCEAFALPCVHSEYGMTELLSQAYAQKEGVFFFPPWAKAIFRDPNDPFDRNKEQGGINIIDLANVESCAFIETQDLGKRIAQDGKEGFEVLGRFDNSDIRGCNLLVLS